MSRVVKGSKILSIFVAGSAMMLYSINSAYATPSGDLAVVESTLTLSQQDEAVKGVQGKIIDEDKNPIMGASVRIMGTRTKTFTDASGAFSIEAKSGDVLEITAVGFGLKEVAIEEDSKLILVNLEIEKAQYVDPINTGYGIQERDRYVGAMTTVKGEVLDYSNSNFTPSLMGNVAGVVGWQNSGQPGILTSDLINTDFYIRGLRSMLEIEGHDGTPLILMDGIEINELDLARIRPQDIAEVSVLKDASATAIYGVRGANGVVLLTSKTSSPGEINITASYEQVFAQPTFTLDFADPVTYMNLFNRAVVDGNNTTATLYETQKIERTMNPNYASYAYPANNWMDQLYMPTTTNSRLGLNVSGGTKTIAYYTSFTMDDDMGMLNTYDKNVFNANIDNKLMTFRANMTATLNKGITLSINSYTTFDEYSGPVYIDENPMYTELGTPHPGYIGDMIYKLAFDANPVNYAMVYPQDEIYSWEHARFGNAGDTASNPYLRVHEGLTVADRFFSVNKFEYNQELDFVTEGLNFNANVMFQKESFTSKKFLVTPAEYSLNNSYYTTGVYALTQVNSDFVNTFPTYKERSSVNTSVSGTGYELKLSYARAFGDHSVDFLSVYDGQEYVNKNPEIVGDSEPLMYKNFGTRIGYGYQGKYFFETSYSESGYKRISDDYLSGQSFAAGVAYLLSNEDFFKDRVEFVDYLKLRASYGYTYNNDRIEGTYHEWDIPRTYNMGIDVRMLDGLTFSADYFNEMRNTRQTDYSIDELNDIGEVIETTFYPGFYYKTKTTGYEIAASYQKAFSKDLWIVVGGTLSHNKTVYHHIQSEQDNPVADYQSLIGHDVTQQMGYVSTGIFSDVTEISKAPTQADAQVGGIRYADINNDRVINELDMLPIGLPTTPRYTYGLNGTVHYKGIELSFSFQGVGESTFFIDSNMIAPFQGDGSGVLTAIADSHWSPDNMVDNAFWPRLNVDGLGEYDPTAGGTSGVKNPDYPTSTFFMNNGSYLRCRHIELAYMLPKELLDKVGLDRVKVYARTDNPFVISDFKIWDPELKSNALNYPILKSYSVGISLSF